MSDVTAKVARPVRTAGQATVSWIVVEGIDAFLVDLDERQYGVAVAGLTVLFGWIQIVVENKFGAGILRTPDE